MQKILLLDSCLFPLLQIPCIDNNQRQQLLYCVKLQVNYNYLGSSYTCANQYVFTQENNVKCAHKNSYTLHIHTCVHECLHHLLLVHTTIIKMSLSYFEKRHWFQCPHLPMHVSLFHYFIDWSSFHFSPLSSIPPHCFFFPSLHSFRFLSRSLLLFHHPLFNFHYLLIKLSDYN